MTKFKYSTKIHKDFVELVPRWKKSKGLALVSYLRDPVILKKGHVAFLGHSNKWEARTIAEWFVKKGYTVHAIDFMNNEYVPPEELTVIFDIYRNLDRLNNYLKRGGKKILHLTGSDPFFQNIAEKKRINDLYLRRGCQCLPSRQVADPAALYRSIESADYCSLIGSQHTLKTFPARFHGKITLTTVSASFPVYNVSHLKGRKEFLWYFGAGAVHKGLDLLLDFFSEKSEFILNIVGNVTAEEDFIDCYRDELFQRSNIRFWGYLAPSSKEFKQIVGRCLAFVAPSCSESISTAAATCMQMGLYPIVSMDTGISLPSGCGRYLKRSDIEEIGSSIKEVTNMNCIELNRQVEICQAFALKEYSRKSFKEKIGSFLGESIKGVE